MTTPALGFSTTLPHRRLEPRSHAPPGAVSDLVILFILGILDVAVAFPLAHGLGLDLPRVLIRVLIVVVVLEFIVISVYISIFIVIFIFILIIIGEIGARVGVRVFRQTPLGRRRMRVPPPIPQCL